MKEKEKEEKNSKTKKIILGIALGVAAVGGVAYGVYKYRQNHFPKVEENEVMDLVPAVEEPAKPRPYKTKTFYKHHKNFNKQ